MEKLRRPRGGAPVVWRKAQELGWHREFASVVQTGARYFEKIRRRCEKHGAKRDALVDVPGRKLSGFVIGK